jgi:beta-mannosidase
MFANMDYPVADAAFRAEIDAEAAEVLDRLQRHACVAAYCGGSEVAQQAAMMGLPEAQWSNDFFLDGLRAACAERHPGVPYFPVHALGRRAAVPRGRGHRALLRRRRVPQATRRCAPGPREVRHRIARLLEPSGVRRRGARVRQRRAAAAPSALEGARAARRRAGWDFEDIRDHYLKCCSAFARWSCAARTSSATYDLSRVVPGEVMQHVFSEWRAPDSGCGGALVWHYRDAWPGAGWGITDSDGRPKAAWWYLRRAWTARAVRDSRRGPGRPLDPRAERRCEPLAARVEIETYRRGRAAMAPSGTDVDVPAHGARSLGADALLGRFTDIANAYRFGPPKHDVVAVRLVDRASGAVIAEDFQFPAGHDLPVLEHAAVRIEAREESAQRVSLTIESDAFLQAVSLVAEGWTPQDNHFHLVPGRARIVRFAPRGAAVPFRVEVRALNLAQPLSRLRRAAGRRGGPRLQQPVEPAREVRARLLACENVWSAPGMRSITISPDRNARVTVRRASAIRMS